MMHGPICVIGYNRVESMTLAMSIEESNSGVDVRSFGATSVMPDIRAWAFKTVVVIDQFPPMSLQEMRIFCRGIEICEDAGAVIETVRS